MTTVLAVYNSGGCVGRCDANCHNAAVQSCRCICGGRNHGVGLMMAIANNAERVGLDPADLRRFAAAHRLDPKKLFVCDALSPRARAEVPMRRRELARSATRPRAKSRSGVRQLSLF